MPVFSKTSAVRFYQRYYVMALLIFVLNLVLKMLFLCAQDLSHDEPFSVYHAQFDVPQIIYHLKAYNNPPLYELILHYWIKLFGISAFAVRLLPCLFGALSAAALYLLGSRFFSFATGLVAALLLTCSTMCVYYSHDCRAYTLFLLLTILSFYFYVLLNEQPQRRLCLGLYALINACLLYAHYFGFIVLFIQLLHVLVSNRSAFKRFVIANAITLLLYIPQVLAVARRFQVSASQGTWVQEPVGPESLYNMLWSFSNAPVLTVLCLCLLAAAVCFFIYGRARLSPMASLLIIWFFVPFTGMFALSYKVPMYLDRYLIFILPAYYLLLAQSVRFIFREQKYQALAFVLLIGVFAGTINLNPDKKRRVADMISYIKARQDQNTLVLVGDYDFLPTFAYHYSPQAFKSISRESEYGLTDSLLRKDGIVHIRSVGDVDTALARHYGKIIYMEVGSFSPLNGLALAQLQKHGREIKQVPFYSIFRVHEFATNP